jgi:hypothetical protein
MVSDQICILQIDVWSVHRSLEFRDYMKTTWTWISITYIPGGCTGVWQVCDVGIQRPFKHSVKKAQLDDVIKETTQHLENGVSPSAIKLDTSLPTLRARSVAWFIAAHDTISNPQLIKKAHEQCTVGEFNLSFESVTSSRAIQELLRVQKNDPNLWEKISADPLHYDSMDDADKDDIVSGPFESDCDTQDDLDSATLPSVLIDAFLRDGTSPDTGSDDNLPLAEQLDPGEVSIPAFEDLGRGKRRIRPNVRYRKDFELNEESD